MTLAHQIEELQRLRRLLQDERKSIRMTRARLIKENNQLRVEKTALLNYIKELEAFNPVK